MLKIIIPAIVFLILLLLFPSVCVQGAASGLCLWLDTMVPTLFPFLIITNILRDYHGIPLFEHLFSPILSRIFKTGSGGAYPVILGCLCGYPMGAKAVCDSLSGGRIQPREADYLITFVNNPSPVYMTGYVCLYILGREDLRFPLLMIILTVPAITAFIIRRLPGNRHAPGPVLLAAQLSRQNSGGSLNRCITDACDVLVKVGGFMMIFSVFSALIQQLPGIPAVAVCIIAGLLEQTTGLALLKAQAISAEIKTVLAMVFVCFGGLSILAQTYSIIHPQGLSVKKYIFGKIISGTAAGLLTLGWLYIARMFH